MNTPHSTDPLLRILTHPVISKCDFFILDPEHYRGDGKCRCDDPDHEVMSDWGYEWSDENERWTA